MATPTEYTYALTDFPNDKVATDRLTTEIQASDIVTALDYINADSTNCDIWFKDPLSTDDETTLDGIVAAHSGNPLDSMQFDQDGNLLMSDPRLQTNDLGNLSVASDKPIGFVVDEVTPNLADKTTWWNDATPLVDVTMENSDGGTYEEYKLPSAVGGDQTILDFIHGHLTNEDLINMTLTAAWQQALGSDASAHPVIKVDGTLKVEDEPFGGAQHDYSVDYETGRVTFHSALSGSDVVTISCGLPGTWTLIIQPGANQTIQILQGEVQWSNNVILKDSIIQDVEIYDEDTEQWVVDTMPSGLPKREITKTIMDLLNRSYGNYPTIPKMGGTEGRGIPSDVMQVPFLFPKMQVYEEGQRVRIYAANNTPAESVDSDPAICTITIKTNTNTNGSPGL